MKQVGILLVLSAISAVGLSFVHPFGNARNVRPGGTQSLLQDAHMPPPARAVLVNKCADCHSNETRWPVYARVAPGSWLIERDIVKARQKMNLSDWERISAENKSVLSAKIISQAKHGDMPPLQYRAVHWEATLTSDDLAALSLLRNTEVAEGPAGGTGSATHGKAVFDKRCTGCHAVEENRDGPRLAGAFGRRAGSVSGFTYSDALKKSGIIWSDATLESWLSDPDSLVPDNNMDFSVPKAIERRDLIAFLKSVK